MEPYTLNPIGALKATWALRDSGQTSSAQVIPQAEALLEAGITSETAEA